MTCPSFRENFSLSQHDILFAYLGPKLVIFGNLRIRLEKTQIGQIQFSIIITFKSKFQPAIKNLNFFWLNISKSQLEGLLCTLDKFIGMKNFRKCLRQLFIWPLPWRCQAGEGIFFGNFKVFPIAFPDHCFTKQDAPESHLGVTSVKFFKNQIKCICDSWSTEFELKNGYLEIYTPKRYEIFLLRANAAYPYKWNLIWCFFVSKLISCNLHTIELYT